MTSSRLIVYEHLRIDKTIFELAFNSTFFEAVKLFCTY